MVNTEIFEKYLQQFKEDPKSMPSYINPHFWESSSEFVTRGEFDSRLEGLSDSIEKKL